MPTVMEQRTFNIQIEEYREVDKAPVLRGHAALFNIETEIMPGPFGFREKIKPGAFSDSIQADDVRALFNHNPDYVIGRNTAGTLRLKEDSRGLAIEVDPPDTQFAKDLMVSMKRGDITQMSFGFQVLKQEWIQEDGKPDLRVIEKVKLFDVSPVTFPAYEGTDIAVRSHDEWRKQSAKAHNLITRKLRFKGLALR